ncbi:UDP-glucose 4-epimerase GalE [Phytohabitans kaempferiae]|uniref:UDP-glucose 4-epimerase n=1 Tax=Phytohabitans kaempferiae TaxID=1620943 RepID=A0ABV6M7K6_9ACTN
MTGGAGYIGGAVVRGLLDARHRVVVLDDLSTGDPAVLPAEVPLVCASVTDPAAVRRALSTYAVTGVVHLAGRKSVAESVARPLAYYRQNVAGTLTLVEAMVEIGVRQIVLSSSAAVYGAQEAETIEEDAVPRPMNPYGATKLASEWVVADAARAGSLSCVILRYFNVAGAWAGAADRPAHARRRTGTGLVPLAVEAVARGESPTVFGHDYPTPDGSCVRDYVHVRDVASAHVAAVEALEGGARDAVYNVGSGVGYSVGEVLDTIRWSTGIDFVELHGGRRPGDPPKVIGSIDKIRRELGWRPRYGLSEMIHDECEMRGVAAQRGATRKPPIGAAERGEARRPPLGGAENGEREPRIVIFTAAVGAGHAGAARELTRRLQERGFQVDCWDLVEVFPWRSGRLLLRLYHGLLSNVPWTYDALFTTGEHFPGAASATRSILRPLRRQFLRLVPPDTRAVVSTFPIASQILGPLRVRGDLEAPLITYLTDFGVYPSWVSPGVDIHCAVHETTRAQAHRYGATDVRLAGRLVSKRFQPGSAEAKQQARVQFGLPAEGRLALLVAGSWGVGDVIAAAEDVDRSGVAIPVVVCARNTAMYRRLKRRQIGHPLGWVEDMVPLMHAVDVLVENAGGLTALEGLACGLPVATYRPIPGHGKVNAATMAEAGVVAWVRQREALGPILLELIEGARGERQREAGLALFEADPATLIAEAAKRGPASREL